MHDESTTHEIVFEIVILDPNALEDSFQVNNFGIY